MPPYYESHFPAQYLPSTYLFLWIINLPSDLSNTAFPPSSTYRHPKIAQSDVEKKFGYDQFLVWLESDPSLISSPRTQAHVRSLTKSSLTILPPVLPVAHDQFVKSNFLR